MELKAPPIPLQLPEHWTLTPLSAGVELYSGQHVLAKDYNTAGRGTPYLTGPSDFPAGRIEQNKFTERPTTLCRAGDVLVTVKGSGAGTMVVADGTYCISRQLMAIRPRLWDGEFLAYSLLQNATAVAGASAGLIPGLSRADVLGQQLPIPPASEQRTIAAALRDVDALISSSVQLITKKRDLKQAAMQRLLTGEERLPGFTDPRQQVALRDTGTFGKGKGIKRDDVSVEGLPCIRYGEIYTRYAEFARELISRIPARVAHGSQRIQHGDLVFAASGETAEEIGKVVAFLGAGEAYAGGDTIILTPNGPDPLFLGYALNQPSVVAQKSRMAQGDAVVHIGARQLGSIELFLPEPDEQRAIAAVLSDMDAELAALEQHLTKTRALKQAMMQELLTGRTRLEPFGGHPVA